MENWANCVCLLKPSLTGNQKGKDYSFLKAVMASLLHPPTVPEPFAISPGPKPMAQ